jgi:hypothetical protein
MRKLNTSSSFNLIHKNNGQIVLPEETDMVKDIR